MEANGIEGFKFIFTVWSPPSHWKSNGSLKDGGRLLPEHYEDFGYWLVEGIDKYAEIGIQLYGLSPQNEPLFSQFYNSCVYTPEEYRDMLRVVGPIVHQAYPDVKIFGPEHMLFGVARDWDWDHLDPTQAVLTDSEASQHLDIWACHGYGPDGATPDPNSEEADYWTTARERVGAFGKKRWMTETSGYSGDWDGIMDYVMSIHAALAYGEVSAWVHWYGAEDLVTEDALTKMGHAAKHYFRFVRPGAVALGTSCEDPEVLATAFRHDEAGTLTVVVVNSATRSKRISFTGTGLPMGFEWYLSTRDLSCEDQGKVDPAGIELPPRSISTFFSTD